jgi:hypothetical protein
MEYLSNMDLLDGQGPNSTLNYAVTWVVQTFSALSKLAGQMA